MPCGLARPLDGSGTLQSWTVGGLQMACNGSYVTSTNFKEIMMGAIKPALTHRIPSELRSRACSGASRTGMGDTLGSPRVAPLLIFVPLVFISRLFFHNFYGDLFLLP